MIIAQISDTHIDPAHENGADRLRDLQACVDDINALDPRPDVVLHTGDIAHNGDAEKYEAAAGVLKQLKSRLLVAAGNRDDRALLPTYFDTGRDLMPGTPFLQYVVDDYPLRLIALDTLSERGNQGDYCDARAGALRRALSEAQARPTMIFMHHPPFEVRESKYPRQFDPWEGAVRLASALEGADNVLAGVCGHSHRDAGGDVAGVPFSSVPSVAVDLRLGAFPPDGADAPAYRLHRFSDGNGIESETRLCR